jgi:hypothetical protein
MSEMIKVETSKVPGVSVEFAYELGANLPDATAKHGDAAVYTNYIRGATIEIQNVARRMIIASKTPDSIVEFMNTYKLGEGVKLATPLTPEKARDAILNGLPEMTPEQRTAFIRDLMRKAKEAGLA